MAIIHLLLVLSLCPLPSPVLIQAARGGETWRALAWYTPRCVRQQLHPALVAATVVDGFQGRGLGRLLLLRLTEAARERGVRAFHWELAERNSLLRSSVHEAAPGLWPERGEDGVVAVEVPLPAAPLAEAGMGLRAWRR